MPLIGIVEIVITVVIMVGNSINFGQAADPTTFAAKSSMLGNIRVKTERSQALRERSDQEPATICVEAPGKMCIHNLTRYISSIS